MKNENLNITVVGIGGGAQNAINHLVLSNKSKNINFAIINSDKNILETGNAENKVLIHGENENFYGLGCAGSPQTGEEYAQYSLNKIEKLFSDTNVAFLISCFGGGCGTGATPVVAKMLKDKSIKTIAIITKPFGFEGKKRTEKTDIGLEKIEKIAEKTIILDNEKLLETIEPNTTLKEAFIFSNKKIAELFEKEITELTK